MPKLVQHTIGLLVSGMPFLVIHPIDTFLISRWVHASLQSHSHWGWGQSVTARILSSSVDIPSDVRRCPKYFTCFWNNAHFLTLSFSSAVVNRGRTSPRFLRLSSKVLPVTIMSSRCTRQVFQCSPLTLSTCSIIRRSHWILFSACPCLQYLPVRVVDPAWIRRDTSVSSVSLILCSGMYANDFEV